LYAAGLWTAGEVKGEYQVLNAHVDDRTPRGTLDFGAVTAPPNIGDGPCRLSAHVPAPDCRALLTAALGFALLDGAAPELAPVRAWLGTWRGIGLGAAGMARQVRPQPQQVRRARLAGDVLDERDGALADGRDRDRLGAESVAGICNHGPLMWPAAGGAPAM